MRRDSLIVSRRKMEFLLQHLQWFKRRNLRRIALFSRPASMEVWMYLQIKLPTRIIIPSQSQLRIESKKRLQCQCIKTKKTSSPARVSYLHRNRSNRAKHKLFYSRSGPCQDIQAKEEIAWIIQLKVIFSSRITITWIIN